MRTHLAATLAALIAVTHVQAHPQVEHLKEAYKAQGDSLFVPLYWLPETRKTVREHIPGHENWVGFESGLWQKATRKEKMRVLERLGAELDKMEGEKVNATWKRIADWQSINAQLNLLITFIDSHEKFFELAFEDPVLRSAFDWITARRPPDFDTRHVGNTLASGEIAELQAVLIERLLNTPEEQRFECFSRIFAKIAASRRTRAEPSAPADCSEPDSLLSIGRFDTAPSSR